MTSHHRRWPWITKYGVHFVHSPADHRRYRIDPNGAARAAERRASLAKMCPKDETGEPLTLKLPPHVEIYLQVLDTSAGWVDQTLCIETETMRFYHYDGATSHYAGDPHRRRKASHLSHVLIPVVAAMAPFLAYSTWRHEREEAVEGMSRFGLDLLRKIKGQLDPVLEGMLRKALMNEWNRKKKLERSVDYFQACGVLDACDLVVSRVAAIPNEDSPGIEVTTYLWIDSEGDVLGRVSFEDGEPFAARVLGTQFLAQDAKERERDGPTQVPKLLTQHYRTIREEREDARLRASGSR